MSTRQIATAAITVIVALLSASPSTASAEALPGEATMRAIAVEAFGVPACGEPTVTPVADGNPRAIPEECLIEIPAPLIQNGPTWMCHIYVHEWGHVVLGRGYFDGHDHSPDPNHVMWAGVRFDALYKPCVAAFGGPADPFAAGELAYKRDLLNDRTADVKSALKAAARRCRRTGRCAAENRLWGRLERLLVRRARLG